jgi:hypothetical protein
MHQSTQATPPDRLKRATPLIVLCLTTLGAGLRFYDIGSKGLWLDEAFSVWLGWQPLPEMIAWLLKVDQHPPLYYALLHLWMTFGDNAIIVRSLSAFIGTLTVPVFYVLGKTLGDWKLGLTAALLLAISPFHVRFAQETRMYTTLTLNACIALLFFFHLLTDKRAGTDKIGQQISAYIKNFQESIRLRPRTEESVAGEFQRGYREVEGWVNDPTRPRLLPISTITTDLAWVGYIIFSAATMLTHNTAVLFPISLNLFTVSFLIYQKFWGGQKFTNSRLTPPSPKNWFYAQLGVFLLWSPWLAAFIIQATGVYGEFWIPSPSLDSVKNTIFTFLSWSLPGKISWDEIIWVFYGLIFLLGIIYYLRQKANIILLLTLFLVPPIVELLVSLKRPIFYDRTLIWTTLPLFLIVASGILQLRFKAYILTAGLFIISINGLSLQNYFTNFQKEQWNLAARSVAESVSKDDILIFNATWVQIPFDFYFRYFNRDVEERGAPVDLFDRGILEPKMTLQDLPRLKSLIRGRDRVWLIYSHNWYTDPQNLIPTALNQELELVELRRYYGLEVHLYGIP